MDKYSLLGDSVITICWVTSEKKRLSLFHRNRVMQIRFHTELGNIFYVRSSFNPSDIGTKPNKLKDDDVGPNSCWENGLDWMRNGMEDALESDI